MENQPVIIELAYTYKKAGEDVSVINLADLPIDSSLIRDQQIVHIGPGAIGGNHKHPRTEWFVGFGDMVVFWLDEHGVQHEELLQSSNGLRLIMIPPYVPHAVVNRSKTSHGVLYELADMKQTREDVEFVQVT